MLDKDLLLDAHHDLLIDDYDLQLTTEKSAVKQRVKQTILTFKGDWFLNIEMGIPYYENILGHKKSQSSVEAILIEAIKKTQGVQSVDEFKINFDSHDRIILIKLIITDITNNKLEIEV